MSKSAISWILAIIITLGAAYYQRVTGPTYPVKKSIEYNGKSYKVKFPRSATTGNKCLISLPVGQEGMEATLFFHRFNVNEVYDSANFSWDAKNKCYNAWLPSQPPAGKLQYYVGFKADKQNQTNSKNPIVLRFKGDVPGWLLIPHILFMFFAMLLSTLTGLLVLFKVSRYRFYTWLTLIILFIGGMLLGPLVQKYAFGSYWTGAPSGWDLTDNKTLIAFVFWLAAALGNLKKDRPWLSFLAAVILIAVYSIPHSMFGSELNYKSGKVISG